MRGKALKTATMRTDAERMTQSGTAGRRERLKQETGSKREERPQVEPREDDAADRETTEEGGCASSQPEWKINTEIRISLYRQYLGDESTVRWVGFFLFKNNHF